MYSYGIIFKKRIEKQIYVSDHYRDMRRKTKTIWMKENIEHEKKKSSLYVVNVVLLKHFFSLTKKVLKKNM